MLPVIVILIAPELEFDESQQGDAVASTIGGSSLFAGSVDNAEDPVAGTIRIATRAAKHIRLSSRLNAPSRHPDPDASSHTPASTCYQSTSLIDFLLRDCASCTTSDNYQLKSYHP